MKKGIITICLILFAFVAFTHANETEEIVFLCKVPKAFNLMPALGF